MAVNIRRGPKTGVIRHVGNSLPIEWRERPSILGAIFLALFGAQFTAIALGGLPGRISEGALWDEPLLLPLQLVLGAIGLGLVWWGVTSYFHRSCLRIDETTVRFRETRLAGTHVEWSEPLSAYRGVLPTRRVRRDNDSRYTDYLITLKHERDPERDIELYRMSRPSRVESDPAGEAEQRCEAEDFARLFRLPVLAEEEDGRFATRGVGDLDKSVGERMAEEGRETPDFDPRRVPAGSKLKVWRMAGGYVFEAGLTRDVPLGLIFTALGGGLMYLYFRPGPLPGEGSPWVVPVVGGMFAAGGLLILFVSLFRVERLEASPGGVRAGQVRPGSLLADDGGRALTPADIEEVAVRKNAYGRFRVTISGDRGDLTWGKHLSAEERRYVRDGILAALTR